jgi:ABC-type dipeptide/oligopeptide/nickel transport system ATPase component
MSALVIQNLCLTVANKTLVDSVSVTVKAGQCVALVGESGSGKSLTALACARLLPDAIRIARGDVVLNQGASDAVNVFDLPRSALASIRGKRIGMVFQEPSLALNPVLTIGDQLIEALALHTPLKGAALKDAAADALAEVGIPNAAARLGDYPDCRRAHHRARCAGASAGAGAAKRIKNHARHGAAAYHPRFSDCEANGG